MVCILYLGDLSFILEDVERLNDLLQQYKIPIALSFVGLILILGGLFSSGLFKHQTKLAADQFPKESIVDSSSNFIKVDISGAVKNPGVYSLSNTDRVEDLIKKSGGFSSSASAEYISKQLNLSQKISDGQKVYIPFEGEKYSGGLSVAGMSSSRVLSKVGINSGSLSELDTLPGVGPVTAQKIIDGRPYGEVNDLIIKKVVSKSVFEKIRGLVSLD